MFSDTHLKNSDLSQMAAGNTTARSTPTSTMGNGLTSPLNEGASDFEKLSPSRSKE
jgi:hypothetical protein